MTDFTNEEQERWGSFDDAKTWSDEDFLKKTPRQRLQWLESAQHIYRLGQARLKARQPDQSRGTS